MYLAHHILWRGILPSWENVWAVQEFPMPETYTQVRTFCGLVGHYRMFIKGFANIACPLYDMLGKEVKMGPVDLPPMYINMTPKGETEGVLAFIVPAAGHHTEYIGMPDTRVSNGLWPSHKRGSGGP